MTYLEFLLWFLILPIIFLVIGGILLINKGFMSKVNIHHHWLGVAILVCIAFVWTTPWDNYLIYLGVWDSPPERVIGRIGYVPLEEYAFFILMPIFNGAIFLFISSIPSLPSYSRCLSQKKLRLIASIIAISLLLLGALLLTSPSGSYLGLIIIWFTPPLAIQWIFNPIALINSKEKVILGTFTPLLYFFFADRFAIQNGIWKISTELTTEIYFFDLPIEEFIFFFVTSLLLAQGMVLWNHLKNKKI